MFARKNCISLLALLIGVGLSSTNIWAQDDVKLGAEVYAGTCIACHGEMGKGAFPSVPNMTLPKGPFSKTDAVLLDHIINGFQSPDSDMEMPVLGGNEDLTKRDIKNVLAYMRMKFQSKK